MQPTQKTLRKAVSFSGIGLHTGAAVNLTLAPAQPFSGIKFYRSDMPGSQPVKASIENVREVFRGTTLGCGEIVVHTVEHLLAALYAMGIDNAEILLDGPEPPVGDGSALPFMKLIQEAGIEDLGVAAEVYRLRDICTFCEGDKSIASFPSETFEITFHLSYKDNIIPSQKVHLTVNEDTFASQIAQARTFGFEHEFEMLKEKHLAVGGNLDNAVVVRRDGSIMNPDGLRCPNEFALHKILDLIGDLSLIGRRLYGHITACKTGHAWNIKLARRLCELQHQEQERNGFMMNVEEIKQILPHRYPFLLVDRVISLEPGVSAVGYKNLTANEGFFNGHFPQRPVMPGVLIVEAMAQVGGVLFLSQPEYKGKIPFFCGIDGVRFRKPVVPGDRLEMHVKVLKVRGSTGKVQAEAKVEGEMVASGELMFMLV